MDRHHILHAVRADLLRRLDRTAEAAAAHARTANPAEQAFLQGRMDNLPES
ncbi:hypothetical protein [Streptomonospora litoralis]|uniref:Uncharacterized protein n=1 Tax=Streptomonospora litoralis TaxID=2498135 RepID=A0A4P6PUP8_9ACTN|nr:hypothetical protein [Streptomonospora litoralis]QBI51856.1 hypothetical protein EKD16_00145 [Streptomonospora litoralis]